MAAANFVCTPVVIPLCLPSYYRGRPCITPETKIEISCDTPGANIFYTINGRQPNPFESWQLNEVTWPYTEPLTLHGRPGFCTVRAVAVDDKSAKVSSVVTKILYLVSSGSSECKRKRVNRPSRPRPTGKDVRPSSVTSKPKSISDKLVDKNASTSLATSKIVGSLRPNIDRLESTKLEHSDLDTCAEERSCVDGYDNLQLSVRKQMKVRFAEEEKSLTDLGAEEAEGDARVPSRESQENLCNRGVVHIDDGDELDDDDVFQTDGSDDPDEVDYVATLNVATSEIDLLQNRTRKKLVSRIVHEPTATESLENQLTQNDCHAPENEPNRPSEGNLITFESGKDAVVVLRSHRETQTSGSLSNARDVLVFVDAETQCQVYSELNNDVVEKEENLKIVCFDKASQAAADVVRQSCVSTQTKNLSDENSGGPLPVKIETISVGVGSLVISESKFSQTATTFVTLENKAVQTEFDFGNSKSVGRRLGSSRVSPGRGYWRQQIDYISKELKTQADNSLEFRSTLSDLRMTGIKRAIVHEGLDEMVLVVNMGLFSHPEWCCKS